MKCLTTCMESPLCRPWWKSRKKNKCNPFFLNIPAILFIKFVTAINRNDVTLIQINSTYKSTIFSREWKQHIYTKVKYCHLVNFWISIKCANRFSLIIQTIFTDGPTTHLPHKVFLPIYYQKGPQINILKIQKNIGRRTSLVFGKNQDGHYKT